MRTRVLVALAAAAFLGGCQTPAQEMSDSQRSAIASEVNAAVDGLFAAMNGHDAEDVLGRYEDSADFVYVGCTSFRISKDSYAWIVRQYYPKAQDVTFEHEIVHTNVLDPTTAVVTLQGSSSDNPFIYWTQVWVKRDGTWLVAHEHESWPGCSEPSEHPIEG